jgi:hypothetical protein
MRVSRILKVSALILFVTGLTIMPALAKGKGNDPASRGLRKIATNDIYHPMLINNIFNYYSNNGDGSFNNFSSTGEGFEFPKGLDKATVIFEDGVVWGCKQNGTLKVGGSTYWHGLQAGPIITNGTATTDPVADDPESSANRLFRVRPDLKPIPGVSDPEDPAAAGELAAVQNSEVALIGRYEVGIKAKDILAQYWADWNEWPATKGAPYKDMNNNGQYDPTVDIPGVPGADQTMWYVSNDLNKARVNTLSGSTPIGIEMQKTIWAYNLSGALANTIFASTKIINKSGKQLDSMFVAQWSDPDLGDASDDFVGCDTIRSLGYVYNGNATDANFDIYGLVVPAVGFDFFQGPMVASAPTDTAIFGLKYRFGYKNLPMTSFNFFINSNNTYADPPHGTYDGTTQWYRLLRGLVGTSGAQYINPITNVATPYVLSGDPVAGTGWIDGTIAGPGDRRMALCSGPFSMVPGVSDTQEVVVANIAGRGADYLSSVTILKSADDFAQSIYNRLFSFPQPPARPKLDIVYLDGKVVLSWGDPVSVAQTEGQLNDQGYTFEGYNVWQLPKNSADGAKLLATFDRSDDTVMIIHDYVYDPVLGEKIYKPIQFGTNSGLVHTFEVDKDAINGGGFINYRNYYFAVTAFNPTPTLLGTSLENAINAQSVIPKPTLPGVAYMQKYGDTLSVTHAGGGSDGSVLVTVIDANALTGDTYKVIFDSSGTWSLVDVTKNTTLVNKAPQTGVGITPNGYVVDGLQITTYGPPAGMKEWTIPSGNRRFSPVGGWAGLGLEGFSSAADPTAYDPKAGTIGMAGNFAFGGIGTTLTSPTQYHTVLLKLAAVDSSALWNPLIAPTDANYSLAYRYLRHASSAAADPSFAPWIINATAGYPYQDFNYAVPFSAWDMETTPPTRLAVGMFENNDPGASVDGRYWPPLTTGDNTVNREFAFIFSKPYSTTPDPALQVNMSNNASTPLMWIMTCNRRADNSWLAGDQFEIVANHINTASDIFTFISVAPAVSNAQAKTDVAKINVFPNPYLGFNKLEPSNYVRFVTFTHLPQKATIRIYNLAGILVRTIVKNDKNQTTTWDLQNESGFPVASGMYIVYMDLPDVGSTKTLKLGVVQEQEFLHHF